MRVVIFGAGSHGRVVAESLCMGGHTIVGWLDDNRALHGKNVSGAPVLGGLDWFRTCDRRDLGAIVAIGHSALRVAVAAKIKALDVPLINAVHPSAVVMPSVKMGTGNAVCAGAIISTEARVGNNIIINTSSSIDHDCVVGDGVFIAPGVCTAGGVCIGENAYVSTGAVLVAGVSIGAGAVVAAGAVVVRDIPPRMFARGVPARVVKPVDEAVNWARLVSGAHR